MRFLFMLIELKQLRLIIKVRYTLCAPMYGKCHSLSKGYSKSSNDVTAYWRKGGKDFLSLSAVKSEENLSPLSSPTTLSFHPPPIISTSFVDF